MSIGERLFGPVAQRLEQGTHNPLVAGSNPAWPIRFSWVFVALSATSGGIRLTVSAFLSVGGIRGSDDFWQSGPLEVHQ